MGLKHSDIDRTMNQTHQRQCPMPAHTMARNADPAPIQLPELLEQQARQLIGEIAIHAIPMLPRLPRRIDIEARPGAEIIALVLARDLQAARARVGIDDGDAARCGLVLEEALLGAVVARAGQAGEEDEHGHALQRVERRGGREEEVQRHVAGGGARGVGEFEEGAAEGGDGFGGGEDGGHG